jgi:hypothetical protein
VDCYLSYFRKQLISHLLSALLPFQHLFTESSCRDQLLASPPFFGALSEFLPLCCVLVFSSLFIVQVFCCCCCCFVGGGVVSLPRELCWFIVGVAGGILCDIWFSPVGLLNVSQAGLEPVSGSVAALLFSQCNMAWRSFPWARGLGCQSFHFPCCFISTKCGSSISARF